MEPVNDTIAAVSSAPGSGARMILRLTGPDALALAEALFAPVRGSVGQMAGFSAVDGTFILETITVPARLYVFRAPASYTRQDLAELHLPGSPALASLALEALYSAGARQAQSGEFTARAFFSGRLDLSEAEAVADLIAASDTARCRAATAMLGGGLHRLCSQASEEIADLLATIEASIDLADEEIELLAPEDFARRARRVAQELDRTAANSDLIAETAQTPRCVLIGRPNVGKSSLLNALTDTDRAIVSALAGTTRDILRATMDLPGGGVELFDAAGLAPALDDLDHLADASTRSIVRSADLLLLVFEAGGLVGEDLEIAELVEHLNPDAPLVLLANKADLPGARSAGELTDMLPGASKQPKPEILRVSARTGVNLSQVRSVVQEMLHLHVHPAGQGLALHHRQKLALGRAAQALEQACDLVETAPALSERADLIAIELRDALAGLGQISGQAVSEEILGRIFRRFCVGK